MTQSAFSKIVSSLRFSLRFSHSSLATSHGETTGGIVSLHVVLHRALKDNQVTVIIKLQQQEQQGAGPAA